MQAFPFPPIARLAVGHSAEVWACRVAIGSSDTIQAVRIYHIEVGATQQHSHLVELIRHVGGLSRIAGIAPYLMVDQWQSRSYVVMPLADYDCSRLVESSERDGHEHVTNLSSIVQQMALSLDTLGQFSLVHGSVCPAHILVRDDRAYLIGFSQMHKLSQRRRQQKCVDLMAHGCMAPEAIAGFPGERSDQFALAATYLSMRAGIVPLGETTWVERAMPTLGENERSVVSKALSVRETDRFESCSAFSIALQRVLFN